MTLNQILCLLIFFPSYLHSVAQSLDYYTTIQPIIKKHCISCHHNAGVGGMALTNYKEVRAYSRMIQYVTENKLMPPWKADPQYSHLKSYNALTVDEIAAIKNWLNTGMLEGHLAVQSKASPLKSTRQVAVADAVLAMEKSFKVSGDYKGKSQVFVIPTGFKKDEIIEAIEFVPGNKKIVKSCTISIDTGQTGTQFDNNDHNYGYSSLTGIGFIPYQYNWYQWTADEPTGFELLPVAKKIPAGSKLLFHISYAASTTPQKDSSYIKFRFVKRTGKMKIASSEVLLDTTHITNGPFVVNKGEKRKFYAERKLAGAVEIYSVMPMGQFALSSWEVYAVDSLTGRRVELLKISHWDAHWKKKYILENPVHLSAGSKIFGIAYYNNSEDNPNLIILPPKKIKYGEGQRDELFIVQFDTVDKEMQPG